MERIYRKTYDPNFFGEIKKLTFGWGWKLFRDNEVLPLSQGKEKYLGNAILSCDNEANRLMLRFIGWNLVNVQGTSPDSSGSSE